MWRPEEPDPALPEQNKSEPSLESRLEGWHYQARPGFQADLKKQLLMQVQNETAQNSSPRPRWWWRWQGRSSGLGIALGGASVVAALVLLVSVLSLGTLDRSGSSVANREAPTVASVSVVSPLAQTSVSVGLASPGSESVQFYNPTGQNFLSAQEAGKLAGFAPRLPTYLPAGLRFDSAGVQTEIVPARPPQMSPPEVKGYHLRYTLPGTEPPPSPPSGTGKKTDPDPNARGADLEIFEWQADLELKLPAPGQPQGGPPVNVIGAQTSKVQKVHGLSAYFIQGMQWRIQGISLSRGGAKNSPPPRGASAPMTPGGRPGFNPPPKNPPGSVLLLGSIPGGQNDFYIDFNRRPDQSLTKSFVWQQGGILNVVSAGDKVSEEELRQVAESLPVVSTN